MPSALTHPVVPLAVGFGLGRTTIPPRLLATGAVLSVLPDLDVLAFRFGIPYSAGMGHRGLSHSLALAVAVALTGAACHRWLRVRPLVAGAFLFLAIASHGVLDSLTTGGLGVAFLWPFSNERFFAPFRVILVAPFRWQRFVTAYGLKIFISELRWVWAPSILIGLALSMARRRPLTPPGESSTEAG